MMLSKNVFIMIVALILVLFGVANVALFRMSGDNYVNKSRSSRTVSSSPG
jgi:hypothetical protein